MSPANLTSGRASRPVTVMTIVTSLVMLIPGIWAWVDPASFADATNWPNHVHFLHDAGVFQVAIGGMLLASLRWRDAPTVVLGGFVFANTLHTINHVTDLGLGGGSQLDILMGTFSVLAGVALALRVRQLRRSRGLQPVTNTGPDEGDGRRRERTTP